MRPLKSKVIESLKIVIYAQSGILAGDLAALLSGHHTVDRQTSLPGVLSSLKFKTDILLMVGGAFNANLPDPTPALFAAKEAHCKVIMLGAWPGQWQEQMQKNNLGPVITLAEIPAPKALFEVIGGVARESD